MYILSSNNEFHRNVLSFLMSARPKLLPDGWKTSLKISFYGANKLRQPTLSVLLFHTPCIFYYFITQLHCNVSCTKSAYHNNLWSGHGEMFLVQAPLYNWGNQWQQDQAVGFSRTEKKCCSINLKKVSIENQGSLS